MSDARTYKNTQSLEKGIRLLIELNEVGRAKPAELAKKTGIDRTTTYRLLATLSGLGLVAQSPSDSSFILRSNVRRLSDGFNEFDRTSRIATKAMSELLHVVKWPSDYATFDQGWMVIQETTHRYSYYSVHRAMVGKRWKMLSSSVGRAFLAGAGDEQRFSVIEQAVQSGAMEGSVAGIRKEVRHLLEDYDERGYAWSVGGSDKRISAIALPIKLHDYSVGAVNVLFFRSSMSVVEAAERFLEPLRQTVDLIATKMLVSEVELTSDLAPEDPALQIF